MAISVMSFVIFKADNWLFSVVSLYLDCVAGLTLGKARYASN